MNDGLREKAEFIYRRLNEFYGQPIWQGGEDPVDELIWTILSANTNDINSGRAFRQLKATFGDDWEAVRVAPLDAIKEAIRPSGMYNQKARHIVETLNRIKESRGGYNLDHLAAIDLSEAMAYLTSLPGVGHKTAALSCSFPSTVAHFLWILTSSVSANGWAFVGGVTAQRRSSESGRACCPPKPITRSM